jgi:3-hydroxyisobutyrate dehydrogenase-like beta-hydroxyacid dehydrogenase
MIGTGLIGAPVSLRLRRAGFAVTAWNRTRAKAEPLRSEGVEIAPTPADAVREAEAVGIIVTDEAAVQAVLEGADGVLAGLREGTLVVDFATTSVEAKRRFGRRVLEHGGRPAEAPFFGTVPEAEQGNLWPAVGAARSDLDAVTEFLSPFCAEIFYVGEIGEASALKLATNVLVFSMVVNIAEAIALARAQGVDPQQLLDLIARGTGVRSPIYQARGRMIIDGDYTARASVDLAVKDLSLIAEAAEAAGVRLQATATTKSLFEQAAAAGYGDEDMAAVYKALQPST